MTMHRVLLLLLTILASRSSLYADGPQDNFPDKVRAVPPIGIELTEEQQSSLQKKLDMLAAAIQELKQSKNAEVQKLLPDVTVFHRAVMQALHHQEMFHERDIKAAETLIDVGMKRADSLKQGQAPWTRETGFVVRGFISDLDGTVQPYGLEIAQDYNFEHPQPVRCDVWFHGRGERSMELHFIAQRLNRSGPFPPETGIVLHPYGRYSNAFKFAGEVDTLEALEHVKQNYRIDDNRLAVRGFSMGGAGCWQFAVHYPGFWFAANPGAGFSETPRFLKTFQGETLNPPWYEEKLWRMYDCDLWAGNLQHLPTVAYSGEIDRQKQAADVMELALKDHNIALTHIIGPLTAHAIHKDSNKIIRGKLDSLAETGRQRFPKSLNFTTFTLKYNRLHWLTVVGLTEHWERSTLNAKIEGDDALTIDADGVTAFAVDFPSGYSPFEVTTDIRVTINGQELPVEKTGTDRSLHAQYYFDGKHWQHGSAPEATRFTKQHDLQGPIDDALMQPFLFVRPTREIYEPKLTEWVNAEMNRAIGEWRRHMRGDVRIKNDIDVTGEDIASYNLILWGTPKSNKLIGQLAERLPIQWTEKEVVVGENRYSATNHLPILIHPNPMNAKRYIVLNSSFTYREYDYLNNARQTPKLPDWAVIDAETPPNFRWPGKVVDAGFFDETWQLKSKK